jgi:hypothetical protein
MTYAGCGVSTMSGGCVVAVPHGLKSAVPVGCALGSKDVSPDLRSRSESESCTSDGRYSTVPDGVSASPPRRTAASPPAVGCCSSKPCTTPEPPPRVESRTSNRS